jgi:hypothetical protein
VAIDFTAFSRGMERGKESQRRDEEFQFQREERRKKLEAQSFDQQAATYTSTLLGNMQDAANAGQNDVTFLIKQRQAIQADRNFQNFRPEVQAQIWDKLNNAATVTADQQLRAGNTQAARELNMAFGGSGVTENQVAFGSGDIEQILAVPATAALVQRTPDGGAIVNGMQLPAADMPRLAAYLQLNGGAQGIPGFLAQYGMEQQQAQANQGLMVQQDMADAQAYRFQMLQNGFQEQPDGTYCNAANQCQPARVSRFPAGMIPAGATPAAQQTPAQAAAAQITAGTPSLDPAAVQQAAAVQTQAAALPAPVAQAAWADLFQQVQQLTELEAKFAATQTDLAAVKGTLDQIPVTIANPSFGSGRGGILDGARIATTPEGQLRMAALQAEITRLEGVLQTDTSALKTVRDNRIPAYARKLSAEATTTGAPGLTAMSAAVKVFVESGSTLDKAQKLQVTSPALVNAYVKGIIQQLIEAEKIPEAARTPKEQKEYLSLRTALDHFNAVRFDKRAAAGTR